MDWTDWYTDTADVFRNEKVTENSLTHMERRKVLSGVACRVYQTKPSGLQMNQTAASITQTDKLACGIEVDIKPGDELVIHRGAKLGYTAPDERYFADTPERYYEPFGAVMRISWDILQTSCLIKSSSHTPCGKRSHPSKSMKR